MSIAVLVPCYNEEMTVGQVVKDFKVALPGCTVYVYDNNSTDKTVERARQAGAVVQREFLQGKGNVVRRMFADVGADVYVLVDGDGTYNAETASRMVRYLCDQDLDMVVGIRRVAKGAEAFRIGHRFGNEMFTRILRSLYGGRFTDVLSGYRVFSHRFVKSFPALTSGFDIESELTIHALDLKMPVGEIETPYLSRPSGSASKLSTFRDGLRILGTIVALLKELRPLLFFGVLSMLLTVIAIVLATPIVITYIETGLVPRLPTIILSAALVILAAMALTAGVILDSVSMSRKEVKRLRYLDLLPTRQRLQQSA